MIYYLYFRWLISQTNFCAEVSKKKKKNGCDDTAKQYFDGKNESEASEATVQLSLVHSLRTKSFKNTGRLLNLTQYSRMFSRRPGICLFYALLNFVTWCAPTVCSVLCLCARWAIRNMFIACWAATHRIAATLPHVVRLPVTPLILSTSFKVLVTGLLMVGFCRLMKNNHIQYVLYCFVFVAGLVVPRISLRDRVRLQSLCSLEQSACRSEGFHLFGLFFKRNFKTFF